MEYKDQWVKWFNKWISTNCTLYSEYCKWNQLNHAKPCQAEQSWFIFEYIINMNRQKYDFA